MSEQDDIDRLAEHWRADQQRQLNAWPQGATPDGVVYVPKRPSTEQLRTIVGGHQAGTSPTHLRLQIELAKARRTIRVASVVIVVQALLLLLNLGLRLLGA